MRSLSCGDLHDPCSLQYDSTTAKIRKQLKGPSVDEQIRENVVSAICDSGDEPGGHYAKSVRQRKTDTGWPRLHAEPKTAQLLESSPLVARGWNPVVAGVGGCARGWGAGGQSVQTCPYQTSRSRDHGLRCGTARLRAAAEGILTTLTPGSERQLHEVRGM